MSDHETTAKITVSCPHGHRIRGEASLSGSTVRCPKCHSEFVFAPPKPAPDRAESDTAAGSPSAHDSVSDTGVMRILGDTPMLPPIPEKKTADFTPCPRCGVSISSTASVCNHCNCYVGVMPHFMQQMLPKKTTA